MGDLSNNFSRWEFACKCGCGFDTVDVETLLVAQRLRDFYGVGVTITSGCRCPAHNLAVGGHPGSEHQDARAVDFTVDGIMPGEVYQTLLAWYPNQYGMGLYDGWVHLDTRSNGPSRWDGRS
jgi:uncharacterized protein YcbK (DUF882 family)